MIGSIYNEMMLIKKGSNKDEIDPQKLKFSVKQMRGRTLSALWSDFFFNPAVSASQPRRSEMSSFMYRLIHANVEKLGFEISRGQE